MEFVWCFFWNSMMILMVEWWFLGSSKVEWPCCVNVKPGWTSPTSWGGTIYKGTYHEISLFCRIKNTMPGILAPSSLLDFCWRPFQSRMAAKSKLPSRRRRRSKRATWICQGSLQCAHPNYVCWFQNPINTKYTLYYISITNNSYWMYFSMSSQWNQRAKPRDFQQHDSEMSVFSHCSICFNWGYNPLTKWDEPPSTVCH